MSSGQFIGLDIGTQSTKGVVLDADTGHVIARAGRAYGLIADLNPGAAEQHPDTWVSAAQAVITEMLAHDEVDMSRLAGIGISGQQHGLVVLDDEDQVIRPAKLWCDTETADEAREISENIGRAVPTGFTASKILWLKRREPRHFDRVRSVLLPHDYINFRLTDRKTMEAGDASGTGLLDIERRVWDLDSARFIDRRLPDMLPDFVGPGEPAGAVSATGGATFDLPVGLPVATGGGDNMMSAIGSGATTPGVCVVSLGTSGTAFAYAAEPIIDPEGLIASFCDSTGGWLPLLCVMNMTGVTEEVREVFDGADIETLTQEAAAAPAGCDGLLLLPYLQGERVPDLPHASAAITGWRPGLMTRGRLFRAAIESTSLNLALGIDRMRGLGLKIDGIRLVGGGSKNSLWRQVLADVLEVPVMALDEPEAAALGAAIQSVWTAEKMDAFHVTAHDVARRFVGTPETVTEPNGAQAGLYREAKERLADQTARLFG